MTCFLLTTSSRARASGTGFPVLLLAWVCCAAATGRSLAAEQPTRLTVNAAALRQEFQGLGVGAIFYEGHITSLAARQKDERQEQLYDDMFKRVPTRYLQLMIRHDHEPQNDNADPFTPAFDEKNFKYCEHTLAIAKAAMKRRPDIELFATLYTPPAWMKTNNDLSAGGEGRATIKDGHDAELAEFAWAFLDHMNRNGAAVKYLSICNEPDWPHTQPGYCLTAERHADLLRNVGDYLTKMSAKFPKTPKPKLVSPNTLSAPGCVKDYLPAALRKAGKYVEVIGSHDYDPRGARWADLQRLARGRPVWMTEWCARGKDGSEGMINSATAYGAAMHHAFTGGANAWMAYDWAYPPRDSGEALIHIDWGNDYRLTKPYHLFRQWAEPLVPGMKLAAVTAAGPGVAQEGKPGVFGTAFAAADGKSLVVHVVNTRDFAAPVILQLAGPFAPVAAAARKRTSAKEDVAELPDLKRSAKGFEDTLPARSMVTYRFAR
jgi:O-glycosyl hydrolase